MKTSDSDVKERAIKKKVKEIEEKKKRGNLNWNCWQNCKEIQEEWKRYKEKWTDEEKK